MAATAGRTPKPVEQKAAVGRSPGRDSGGRALPETVAELPSSAEVPPVPPSLVTAMDADRCPSVKGAEPAGEECEICLDDLAVAAWQELWTSGRQWLSVQRDGRVLRRLCLAYVEEAHLRARLAEDGPFVSGQRGGLVAHPAVTMLRVLETAITKWEGLCGFNPSDGGRIGIRVGRQQQGGGAAVEQAVRARNEARAERSARAAGARPARGRARKARAADSD